MIALIPSLFFTSLQSQHCQAAASLSEAGVVLVTASAGIIFAYRVFSIWNFHKGVCVSVSILYLMTIACWVRIYEF